MKKHLAQGSDPRLPDRLVAALLARVRELGEDPRALFERAGVLFHPGRLQTRGAASLTGREFAALYRECIGVIEKHASRGVGRLPATKQEIDMLCHCIIGCGTLREVIERATAFMDMLRSRPAELSLQQHRGVATLIMRTFRGRRSIDGFLSDLVGLAFYQQLFSWLIGEPIAVIEAGLAHPPLLDDEFVQSLAPFRIRYGASCNSLAFASSLLDRPNIRTPADLAAVLQSFPFDPLLPTSVTRPLSERVGAVLRAALLQRAALPTLVALSRQFDQSPATLKRRLAEEGTSLRALKDECRYERARRLLEGSHLSLGQVARRLCYSDARTFARAFRQWSGARPADWRRVNTQRPV